MKKLYFTLLCLIGISMVINSQNLVLNPQFNDWDDDNTPTSWTKVESVTKEAVIFQSADFSAKHVGGTKDLGQTIPVTAGQSYEISVSYYVEAGDGSDCRLWSYWKEGTTSLDDNAAELRTDYFPGAASWQTYTATITAPATATDLYLEVRTYSTATVYYDDFSLTEVTITDNDPPVWEAGYPKVMNVDETVFDIAVKLDETSTVYYVVEETATTAPTLIEVKAGTGTGGAAAVAAGNFAAGMDETTVSITGLTMDVSYTVYLVAEDDEDVPNVQADLVTVEVTPTTPPSVLYFADFETSIDPFTQFSESGAAREWGFSNGYIEINGYNSVDIEIDWLISPEIDLTNVTDPQAAFKTAWRYGLNDDTHHMKMFYSTDYDGNTANIGTSTWVEVAFDLPEQDTWTDIGPISIPALEGQTAYVAFVYNYPADNNYTRWRIDDAKILGYAPEGTDATLSDLTVNGETIEGFDPAKTSYVVDLAPGVASVPVVDYTLGDANATAILTDATDLTGDEAARTTTVEVTAQDGVTVQTYSILFNPVVEVANLAELRAATDMDRTYMVSGEVVLTQKDGFRNKKYFEDATGAIEIDDSPGVISSVYNIGDGVTGLTGTIEDYFGLLQMHPTVNPGDATSTGNTVEPQVLTVDEFKTNFEMYESEFVKIEGVTFADAGATFGNNTNYVVSVGENSTVLRTAFFDVLSGKIPNMADIQGVAIWHFSEAKVAPRMAGDLMAYSSDANLSSLSYNGTAIADFAGGTADYAVTLPVGTTDIPVITYTKSDDMATVEVTDVSDLTGDEAARTATIVVTAQDGTTMTYTIVFTVDNTGITPEKVAEISLYPIPADNYIIVKGLRDTESFRILNVLGGVVKTIQVNSDEIRIDLSDLDSGVYLIRSNENTIRFIKK